MEKPNPHKRLLELKFKKTYKKCKASECKDDRLLFVNSYDMLNEAIVETESIISVILKVAASEKIKERMLELENLENSLRDRNMI